MRPAGDLRAHRARQQRGEKQSFTRRSRDRQHKSPPREEIGTGDLPGCAERTASSVTISMVTAL